MKVTKVHVAFGMTVNLGNFNSSRFDVGYEAEVEPDEDMAAVVRKLHIEAREEAKRQALPIVKMNKLRTEDIIQHLPADLQVQILRIVEAN